MALPPVNSARTGHSQDRRPPRPHHLGTSRRTEGKEARSKTSTTLRIDSDVLLRLKGQGKGDQSRINNILRREMLAALKS
jgi:uncharacterized protein (DUF4415 family)